MHVEDLTAKGLLEEGERDSILEEILEKLRKVVNHNLNLHPSGLADVVKTIPLFVGVSRVGGFLATHGSRLLTDGCWCQFKCGLSAGSVHEGDSELPAEGI